MELQPWPRRARGESEDGGGGVAASVGVPDMTGGGNGPDPRQLTLAGPWVFSSPRCQPGPSPQTLPRKPGPADPCPALGPPGLGSLASGRRTGLSLLEGSSPTHKSSAVTLASRAGPCSHLGSPALWQVALGREGTVGTISPTPTKNWDPCQAGRGRGGWGTRTAHLAPSAGHSAWPGWGCLRGPPSSGHQTEAVPRALSLNSCLLGCCGWRLSCSGPWCPPPAPTCSGAAAAEPARPSPGLSGSRPCT